MTIKNKGRHLIMLLLLSFTMIAGAMVFDIPEVYAASSPVTTATAKVTAKSYTNMRKSASDKGKVVVRLKKNTKVTVLKEVFTNRKSTSSKKRWYYVSYGKKKGYVRADALGKFTYTPVTCKTITALNYRVGAGTGMKKKGTFKKGQEIKVLLEVKPKSSSAKWYKIAVGQSIYYVHSAYVKTVTTPTTASTQQTGTGISSNYVTIESAEGFIITGLTYPVSIGQSLPFELKGKIQSEEPMTKVVLSIQDKKGNTVISAEKTFNSKEFDIATLDPDISFGKLSTGNYVYRCDVLAGNVHYKLFQYDFNVRALVWPDKIAATAIALAYPVGTAESVYKYNGGAPSAAYKAALNQVYPNRSNWGAGPKVGASCDVFVGTAVRYSGYDSEMPRGLGDMSSGQWAHLNNSDKWQRIAYYYKESDLRNGDIIIYKRYSGSQHVCIYVKINGQGYLAEAAINTYYGHLTKVTSGSKIFKSSDKATIKVYRATN